MQKLYNVGIYTRLSVEDAFNSSKTNGKNYLPADSSVSIENQKEILSKFVMLNGWIEKKVYADDGFGGGNFQRPAFTEMLEDIKNGEINLVLVRDLSRLGRDYIEVGRYTDQIFPSHGCRFVALLDGIDTAEDNNEMLHFRSLMNDYHLRELSGKIKTVLHAKAQQGQFLGAYAPYGYQKSPEDKHRLVVDAYSSKVVQTIYAMREQGIAYGKIVAYLNSEGILSPFAYWHSLHGKGEYKYTKLWMYASVKDILSKEVYTGTLVQNYTGSLSYKSKKMIYKPESEWIRHENSHEAIVSREQWERVQELGAAAKKRTEGSRKPQPSLFSKKLVCADCKTTLGTNTGTKHYESGTKKYVSYHCVRHSGTGRSVCSWHYITEIVLSEIVIKDIQHYATTFSLDEKRTVDRLKKQLLVDDETEHSDIKQEVQKLEKRLQDIDRVTAELYEDKVIGKISADTFSTLMQKSEVERIEKAARLNSLTAQLKKRSNQEIDITTWIKTIRKYLNLETLHRAVIDELIDHIEIGEKQVIDGKRTQDIRIFYNFVGFIG